MFIAFLPIGFWDFIATVPCVYPIPVLHTNNMRWHFQQKRSALVAICKTLNRALHFRYSGDSMPPPSVANQVRFPYAIGTWHIAKQTSLYT